MSQGRLLREMKMFLSSREKMFTKKKKREMKIIQFCFLRTKLRIPENFLSTLIEEVKGGLVKD